MNCLQRISLQRLSGATAVLVSGAILLSGCGDASSPPKVGSSANGTTSAPRPASDDHGHAHPSEGPHHGALVELGSEEYHAEIVHGEEGRVTVYVLDSGAKQAVPIDAAEVTINLSRKGEAEQFTLPASPDEGDPADKASRFTLKDEHLAEDLDAEGATAKLVITINGKQYVAKIEHDHAP